LLGRGGGYLITKELEIQHFGLPNNSSLANLSTNFKESCGKLRDTVEVNELWGTNRMGLDVNQFGHQLKLYF